MNTESLSQSESTLSSETTTCPMAKQINEPQSETKSETKSETQENVKNEISSPITPSLVSSPESNLVSSPTPSLVASTGKIFSSIKSFVHELSTVYGSKFYSLLLYDKLLLQTKPEHTRSISKHIDAFKLYCASNVTQILEKNIDKLTNENISYSAKVFINVKNILTIADTTTRDVIWKHLLYLNALFDPLSKARELISTTPSSNVNIGDFFKDISEKITSTGIDMNGNPMEILGKVMSSGSLTEILSSFSSKLNSGEINLGSLMAGLGSMAGGMSDAGGEGLDLTSMFSSLMKN